MKSPKLRTLTKVQLILQKKTKLEIKTTKSENKIVTK
jgi:hypothetical protein